MRKLFLAGASVLMLATAAAAQTPLPQPEQSEQSDKNPTGQPDPNRLERSSQDLRRESEGAFQTQPESDPLDKSPEGRAEDAPVPPRRDAGPPPPPPPRGEGPPPPRGAGPPPPPRDAGPPAARTAHFRFERGDAKVDIHCGHNEPTRACVEAALILIDKLMATPTPAPAPVQ